MYVGLTQLAYFVVGARDTSTNFQLNNKATRVGHQPSLVTLA